MTATLNYFRMVIDAQEMSDDNLMAQVRTKECKCGDCFTCVCAEIWELRKHLREMGAEDYNRKLGD